VWLKFNDVSQVLAASIALMMETLSTCEATLNQPTRRYNPEDTNLHTRPRENLKSHFMKMY
jgi:hypothetical protein